MGSGTGTGTFALLERFSVAHVIALDVSAPLLDHLGDRARSLGVTNRIHTVQADLNRALPSIDTVDLAWASSSLHHLADPDRVLGEILTLLRPGGLLVVAEMDSFPRFLPVDLGLGRPGLEARVHAALADRRAAEVPHLGADWAARLSGAGFSVDAERSFAIELLPPLPASSGRYAEVVLRRLRSGLEGGMSPEDLATLDTLVASDGPDGVGQRNDLNLRIKNARRVISCRPGSLHYVPFWLVQATGVTVAGMAWHGPGRVGTGLLGQELGRSGLRRSLRTSGLAS